jgi:hypothetical protein
MQAVLVLLLLTQDAKGPSLSKVLSKTAKEKKYSFTITGGKSPVSGQVDNGGVHYISGSAEVAGKGAPTYANHEGKWVDVQSLLAAKLGGDDLARLARIPAPHSLVPRIAGTLARVSGDGISGFTGEITQIPHAKALAREPWIGLDDIQTASSLRAAVTILASEERVSKVEIQFTGTRIEMVNTGSYYGKPDPANPPTPPAANWQLGPDGYWYEGREKAINNTVMLEFSNYGSASMPEDLKKKFGIK